MSQVFDTRYRVKRSPMEIKAPRVPWKSPSRKKGNLMKRPVAPTSFMISSSSRLLAMESLMVLDTIKTVARTMIPVIRIPTRLRKLKTVVNLFSHSSPYSMSLIPLYPRSFLTRLSMEAAFWYSLFTLISRDRGGGWVREHRGGHSGF